MIPHGPYFNPRPPCGGRRDRSQLPRGPVQFQSTSSVWRTTIPIRDSMFPNFYFNPRPPCGGRRIGLVFMWWGVRFQSTSSVWRTTFFSLMWSAAAFVFQSTSSVWRTTILGSTSLVTHLRFQSTSSVWRTTSAPPGLPPAVPHFNPRPPCGGRPYAQRGYWAIGGISIHVLRVEDDRAPVTGRLSPGNFNPRPPCGGRRNAFKYLWRCKKFQSTSSVWRTTRPMAVDRSCSRISIHVLRVEDDSRCHCPNRQQKYFNPRPPCGGRRPAYIAKAAHKPFQSTSSVWRTTFAMTVGESAVTISIHVLRVEDDDFAMTVGESAVTISIHVLRVEDDPVATHTPSSISISIHVLRVEDDRVCWAI